MGGFKAPPVPDEPEDMDKANRDLDANDRVSRQEAAVTLRLAGANYSQIAQTLGYASATLARQAVERALAASTGEDDKARQRQVESQRLERILQSLWRRATNDKDEQHLAYARTALAVIDRHARLVGADAPQEMVVYNPAGQEIEAWVAQMARQLHGEMPEEFDIIEGTISDDDPVGDDES
jgi:transposase-like protein